MVIYSHLSKIYTKTLKTKIDIGLCVLFFFEVQAFKWPILNLENLEYFA